MEQTKEQIIAEFDALVQQFDDIRERLNVVSGALNAVQNQLTAALSTPPPNTEEKTPDNDLW